MKLRLHTSRRRWSKAEHSLLCELYSTQMSAEDIGTRLGRSKYSILMQAKRIGLHCGYLHHYRVFYNGNLIDKLSEVECAYIAGFVDADGSISTIDGNGRPWACVKVINTDYSVISWVKDRCGGRINVSNSNKRHWGYRPVYFWSTNGRDMATKLLKRLQPYLIIKRDKCMEVLHREIGNVR